jgi:DNA replication protein DnaC
VILTSNRGFDTWSEFLGDEVLAASVLDRFLHFATVFTHSGESYRLKEAKAPAANRQVESRRVHRAFYKC